MWEVCLNVNLNVGYKHIAKNAIYSGNPNLVFVSENITLIGYGKIYNESELKEKMGLVKDSNIVVELYKKYGFEDMLELIEGDYSFILLDYNIHGEESWLYVVRDPFGIYPLYYYYNNHENAFSFTSESYNKKYISFTAGHYQKFSHSHKVSSRWKQIDLPQSFYKLPFFSIYNDVDITPEYKQTQIDLAIKKRLDWIHYKYPEVRLDEIGYFCSTGDYHLPFLQVIPSKSLIKENIKHVFLIEPFTYDWMDKKYLDRRKRITQLYLETSMKEWTNVYGIEVYMPLLDRILIQNIKPVEIL